MSETSPINYSNEEEELPEKLREEIERVAKERRLNKEQTQKLVKEVKNRYANSRFEPGEVIGILAAQSISEPATQMTMRTYHFAGTAGIRVTYGLPRLIEIFDAKKEPETPMMTIYLKKQANNADTAADVANKIIEKRIENIANKVVININENSVEIGLFDQKRAQTVINTVKENIKDVRIKTKGDKIVFMPPVEASITDLQKLREKILSLHISGVKGVSNAVVRKEGEDWIINTIGSNLLELFAEKEVDETRTTTSDIHETATVLGIEAARNTIISEALKTLQEQGLDVDVRHVMLVGDIMTFRGDVHSIGRYGVAGAKTSILARAAFEETIKHLVKASIRNETDNFQGIFENVMIGQVIPSGTGMFDLVAKFGGSKEK